MKRSAVCRLSALAGIWYYLNILTSVHLEVTQTGRMERVLIVRALHEGLMGKFDRYGRNCLASRLQVVALKARFLVDGQSCDFS